VGNLFGGGSRPEVKRMPDLRDPNLALAERRKREEISSRSGRASTVLTKRGGVGEAGTTAFQNTLLGQTQ
jgi:hypothetical protein